MSLFKKTKKNKEEEMTTTFACVDTTSITAPLFINPEPISSEKEEWVWIEGYKGTDKDMCCKGYQYELGKTHIYDGNIQLCDTGFHFCRRLNGVFNFYPVENNNRFFKVKALININKLSPYENAILWSYPFASHDKEVAKKIIFLEEISKKEVLTACGAAYGAACLIGTKFEDIAFEIGIKKAVDFFRISTLIEYGYPELIAVQLTSDNKYHLALEYAKLDFITLDTKLIRIMNNSCGYTNNLAEWRKFNENKKI